MLPSVVTTMPIVECSVITFLVPVSAAFENGISSFVQGVFTILSTPFSICPLAPFIIYPTQSTSRTFMHMSSYGDISAASLGINLGSVVIIVVPPDACGSSSTALLFSFSSCMTGSTHISINLLINVDLPVLTGPTTPRYISPLVRSFMSLYISKPVSV